MTVKAYGLQMRNIITNSTLVFDIWFDGNGSVPSTNMHCDFNARVVLYGRKMQFAMPEIKDEQYDVQDCVIL